MSFKIISTLVAGLFATSIAMAQSTTSASNSDPVASSSADSSRAGKMARSAKRQNNHFAKLDKDKDGTISREEAEAAAREKVALMFERLDTNKDGKLTQEEMRAGRSRHQSGNKTK